MTEPTVLRFEATDIEADVEDDYAILTMETVKDGRVAVLMKPPVFFALSARIQLALEQKAERDHARENGGKNQEC